VSNCLAMCDIVSICVTIVRKLGGIVKDHFDNSFCERYSDWSVVKNRIIFTAATRIRPYRYSKKSTISVKSMGPPYIPWLPICCFAD